MGEWIKIEKAHMQFEDRKENFPRIRIDNGLLGLGEWLPFF